MNTLTGQILILMGFYRVGSNILADFLKAREEGKAVLGNYDPVAGVLSATVPATRQAGYWNVDDVEKYIRDRWYDPTDTFGRHANLFVPGMEVTKVQFDKLAAALLDGLRRVLCENQPFAEPGELPEALRVDLDVKEHEAQRRERQGFVDMIGKHATTLLFDDLTEKVNGILAMGHHEDDHTNRVEITPGRVLIDLRYQSPTYPDRKFSVIADSDSIGDQLHAEWQRRRHPDAAAWYADLNCYPDLWRFEPTQEEFRSIAMGILQDVIKFTNLDWIRQNTPAVNTAVGAAE